MSEFRDNPELRPSDFQLIKCHMPDCNKIFTRRYTFERHIQNHDKMKKHICSFCGKRFGLKQYLKEHIFIHTGEKPYLCPFKGCTKRFRQRGKLSIHKKHHRERDDEEEEVRPESEDESPRNGNVSDDMACEGQERVSGAGVTSSHASGFKPRVWGEYKKNYDVLMQDYDAFASVLSTTMRIAN
eukprot:CAMPEP_0114998534 /NCGR_PEP_ID=MMETSP0216-20121206/15564_1 /TAXON_ID=223996 /ORGANISM="Protocruzia adherens, Strain Boccale" /LENGTH=183 /DNA_ID=CAMNT_0002363149 /DNA_START=114 /DNA_END=665 /DNA_ORIENTATION=+